MFDMSSSLERSGLRSSSILDLEQPAERTKGGGTGSLVIMSSKSSGQLVGEAQPEQEVLHHVRLHAVALLVLLERRHRMEQPYSVVPS